MKHGRNDLFYGYYTDLGYIGLQAIWSNGGILLSEP